MLFLGYFIEKTKFLIIRGLRNSGENQNETNVKLTPSVSNSNSFITEGSQCKLDIDLLVILLIGT